MTKTFNSALDRSNGRLRFSVSERRLGTHALCVGETHQSDLLWLSFGS